VERCEISKGSLAGDDLVAELEEVHDDMDGGGDDATVKIFLGGLAVETLVLDDGDEGCRRARRRHTGRGSSARRGSARRGMCLSATS
jgi:hypothetical protein